MGHAPQLLLLTLGLVVTVCGTGSTEFDAALSRFLDHYGYTGAAVTALKDGRLVLAKGYGVTRSGSEVKPWSRAPVTRVSQSVTAVAVMTLVQRGLLSLEDKVFGRRGILHMIHPIHPQQADPRLPHITVGHLLTHSAGWDSTKAPLYDPVLNEVYRSRGQPVPSIAQAMDVASPVDGYSLIQYVISQPLHFDPGSKTSFSNLGYLLLGRVIEETSKLMYEDYVKKHVLNPCGMWRTRLWLPANTKTANIDPEDLQPPKKASEVDTRAGGTKRAARKKRSASGHHDVNTERVERDVNTQVNTNEQPDDSVIPPTEAAAGERNTVFSLVDLLDPLSVDSVLGWSSTALDMARFMRCVFDDDTVLNDKSLETLLQRLDRDQGEQHDSWVTAGFRTNSRGEVWQDGDPHGDDVIVYHDLLAGRGEGEGRPDTWAVVLHGSHLHHLRHKTHELMKLLRSTGRDDHGSGHGLVPDLNDLTTDGALVKFRVDEHHLDAYVNAVKREGYDLRWVFPYSHHRHTSFLLISRLDTASRQPPSDFRLEHGLGEKQLLSRKLHMERHGYNLTFLQSYRSRSHQQPNTFLAVFRRHAYPPHTQLKYGTGHLPEPYDRLVQMYREKLFHPVVQSVLPHAADKEERLSFVFVHTPGSTPVDFTNDYRLNATELDDSILHNAARGRTLAFLDAYTLQGEPRFAAVFTNATHPRWTWDAALSTSQAAATIQSHLSEGLWPAIAIAYTDDNNHVKFSVFLKSDYNLQRPKHDHPHTAERLH